MKLCLKALITFFLCNDRTTNAFRSVSSAAVKGGYHFPVALKPILYTTQKYSSLIKFSTKLKSSDEDGIYQFDEWFRSMSPTGEASSQLQHDLFPVTGRGLEWKGEEDTNNVIMKVPQSVCLNTSFEDGWDATLATQILNEWKSGDKSSIKGYISLLTRNTPYGPKVIPLSTAPNALRHWSTSQKALIPNKLSDLCDAQMIKWRSKYDAANGSVTQDQFMWAMEAVHSRAFRGDFGSFRGKGKILKGVLGILSSILLIYVGYDVLVKDYFLDNNAEYLAAVCAIAAIALPLLLNGGMEGNSSAVMLPYIDSANHDKTADSSIEYDPIGDCFTLKIGPECYKKALDSDGEKSKMQVYISYGEKSDDELLLNYGFLENMPDFQTSNDSDIYRQNLASLYNSRN